VEQEVKLICCKTMMDEVERIRPEVMPVGYMEYALHRTPENLRQELQQRIDEEKEADILVFIYGHCSRGLEGLKPGIKPWLFQKCTTASPCCWAPGKSMTGISCD